MIACCKLAQRAGVRPGMMTAEALATLPALACVTEDLDADRHTLTQLAEWSQRFSPIVGLEDAIAPSCILIDTTGGAACFGGEEALLQKARAEFAKNGWVVTIALADTIGAAWAQAACGLTSAKPQAALLSALPIAALRLSAATIALLHQLGIERIGQLAELPRDQIAERFGAEVGRRLDQASGRIAEVITPLHPEPEAVASWAFDDPVERRDIVGKVLDILLERLQAILEKRCLGTRLVECVFELDGAETQRLECSLSRPAQTASYLGGLLRTRLEQMRVEAPIRALAVRAIVLERMADEQPNLFDAGSDALLGQLLDNLASRLGRDAVTVVRFVADPQPELACRFESALGQDESAPIEEPRAFAHRPLRLLPRPSAIQMFPVVGHAASVPESDGTLAACPTTITPQRFHHAGADHVVIRCHGPERIETGWWRGNDVQRDYYLVETTDGTRWWIFHRLDDGRWFLHGCFE